RRGDIKNRSNAAKINRQAASASVGELDEHIAQRPGPVSPIPALDATQAGESIVSDVGDGKLGVEGEGERTGVDSGSQEQLGESCVGDGRPADSPNARRAGA